MIIPSRLCRLVAIAFAVGIALGALAADTEPLPMKMPRPNNIKTPKEPPKNLGPCEKPMVGKRPEFLAPKGCVNLSLKRPVTSSDPEPIIGKIEQITDGDKEGVEGSWVELAPDKQWIQVDLGQTSSIYAVVIWHRHDEVIVYKGVIVQLSDDPEFKQNVRTLFNNDQDNSVGLGAGKDLYYFENYQGKLIDAKGAKGRYIRFWSKGNTTDDLNHYTEAEVWGLPK